MKYIYRAFKGDGEEVIDNIDAPSQREAEEKIESMGLDLVDLRPHEDYEAAESYEATSEVQRQQFTRTKSGKGEGFLGGLVAGWGCGIWLIIIGVVLCFTGIGAIIGVPLIIAGLLAFIIGPIMGLAQIKGPCPYCGSKVRATKTQPGVDCPACKKRIVIRDNMFFRVD